MQLIHGNYYLGKCRNARIARWNDNEKLFYHWRDKFGKTFIETIELWNDLGEYDGFRPEYDLGPRIDIPFQGDAMVRIQAAMGNGADEVAWGPGIKKIERGLKED